MLPALVVALVTTWALAAPASADALPPGCHLSEVTTGETTTYEVVCPGGGGTTNPGGGGSAGPACELTGLQTYCIGTSGCWANVPSAIAEEEWPEETRPSPEAIYTYQSCQPDPDGTLTGWSWYEPAEVDLADAARQAFGSLSAPPFTVAFNPPGEAYVGVETWFWSEPATTGTITGTPAFGVVAIGVPQSVEVDPGDGSPVLTCPWTTAASEVCGHTYDRSSAGQPVGSSGLPAYTARARLVYEVRFENAGTPLSIPGLPESLTSGWQAVAVPVAEIQSIVGSSS